MNALQIFEPNPDTVYGIDAVAHLAQIPRRTILVYCKHGLVSPLNGAGEEGYYFDGEAIRELRWIESLRRVCDSELDAFKIIVDLLKEVRNLRKELAQIEHHPRWSSF